MHRLRQHVRPPRFRSLFLAGEEDEEQTYSLSTVIDVLYRRYPNSELFQASEIAAYAGLANEESIGFKAALEIACGKPIKIISAPVINWRLQAVVDAPVTIDEKLLVLQYLKPDKSGRNGGFKVVQLT